MRAVGERWEWLKVWINLITEIHHWSYSMISFDIDGHDCIKQHNQITVRIKYSLTVMISVSFKWFQSSLSVSFICINFVNINISTLYTRCKHIWNNTVWYTVYSVTTHPSSPSNNCNRATWSANTPAEKSNAFWLSAFYYL